MSISSKDGQNGYEGRQCTRDIRSAHRADKEQFRRSIKSDKHDSAKQPVPISVQNKDAIAIEPPKKVRESSRRSRARFHSGRFPTDVAIHRS